MNKILLPLIAIFALAGGYFLSDYLSPKTLNIQSATWLKRPIELPTINFNDHNKNAFTNEQLKNKWSILFFGFTHCPDVCPDSLNMLKTMMEHLEEDVREEIQVVFVTVDPDRDTPELLKKYVTYFNEDFIGAYAEMEVLVPVTKKLGILHYITKTQTTYDVAHAGNILLINPDGQYTAIFSPPHDAVQMAADLTSIKEYF